MSFQGASTKIAEHLAFLPSIQDAMFRRQHDPDIGQVCSCNTGAEESTAPPEWDDSERAAFDEFKKHFARASDPPLEDRQKRCFFRCKCCSHGVLCSTCIVRTHAFAPLHDIEEWTGQFFERRLLRDLGLVWSLRHPGSTCPNTPPDKTRLLAVATENGYRAIRVQYCRCEGRCSSTDVHGEAIQLLECGLWPVTLKSTQSAVSFQALENFCHHWNADKKSAYSYCSGIRAMTDSQKPWTVPVRTPASRLLL